MKIKEDIKNQIYIILIILLVVVLGFFILLRSFHIKVKDVPILFSEKIEETQNYIEERKELKEQEEQDKRGYTYNAYCTSGNATITGPVQKQGTKLYVPVSYIGKDWQRHNTLLPAGTSTVSRSNNNYKHRKDSKIKFELVKKGAQK